MFHIQSTLHRHPLMGTPTVITRRAHLNKLMNFLCFASATATFLWHFLLPYRLNIDTDRPKKRKEERGWGGGVGVIRLQEKLRFRGRVTSLASFEKTRDARVFLCFSISAKYWKLFILIAFDACRPPSPTLPCSLPTWAHAVCSCQLPRVVIHTWMIRYRHTQMYWLISRLLLLTFMASDINLCLCWHLVFPPPWPSSSFLVPLLFMAHPFISVFNRCLCGLLPLLL